MKKLAYAMMASVALFQADAFAQCTNTPVPRMPNAVHPTPVGHGVQTELGSTLLTQTAGGDLVNTEYIITLKNVPAYSPALMGPDTTGGGGDVIIGADEDGMFHPALITRYGLSIGDLDSFQVTAIGYDLQQVKTVGDALLNNEITPGNPCCNIFNLIPEAAGFCDSVRNAGINGAADINNLNDVLNIFDAMSSAQLSIEALAVIMGEVNGYQSLIPTACGKSELPLCYGWNNNSRYTYVATTPVPVTHLSSVSSVVLFPNPASEGYVNVMIDTKADTELMLTVYNLMGERVMGDQFRVNGSFSTQISTTNLAAGMYIVELNDGSNKLTQKLVVR